MLNAYALNEAEINGAREVFGEGAANVSLSASCELSVGLRLEGEADVQVDATGTLNAMLQGEGELAPIELTAELPPMVRVPLESSLSVAVESEIDPYLRMRPDMLASIEIESEGDGKAVPPASATFTIRTSATANPDVITAKQGEGHAEIVVSMSGRSATRRAVHASGRAETFISAWGYGLLTMLAPPGSATIEVEGKGDARKGGRLSGSGIARIDSFASGRSIKWRHVNGQGEIARIELAATDKPAGIPGIPADYAPAPANRTFYVAPDRRDFRVTGLRRTA